MKKQAEVQYMAFHCTRNISQLERAISSTAFPPHSCLHLMFASCISPSLFPFLLPLISLQLFFLFFFLPLPPFSTLFSSDFSFSIQHFVEGTHAVVLHLNAISYTLSHLLKVGKALQAPVNLFPLATDSKWAGSHGQTPLSYTSKTNVQIIHTLCCKKWECGG